jgi:hypothetical protein
MNFIRILCRKYSENSSKSDIISKLVSKLELKCLSY